MEVICIVKGDSDPTNINGHIFSHSLGMKCCSSSWRMRRMRRMPRPHLRISSSGSTGPAGPGGCGTLGLSQEVQKEWVGFTNTKFVFGFQGVSGGFHGVFLLDEDLLFNMMCFGVVFHGGFDDL